MEIRISSRTTDTGTVEVYDPATGESIHPTEVTIDPIRCDGLVTATMKVRGTLDLVARLRAAEVDVAEVNGAYPPESVRFHAERLSGALEDLCEGKSDINDFIVKTRALLALISVAPLVHEWKAPGGPRPSDYMFRCGAVSVEDEHRG